MSEAFDPPFRLRDMTQADIESVMSIELDAYPFPWTEGIFRDCLYSGYHCVVVEDRRNVMGYAVMTLAAGEAHILNICIDSTYRGQGLGRKLLRYLEEFARYSGESMLFLEVRVSNDTAIALYTSAGFAELGRRRGYYPAQGGREDAVVMGLSLKPSANP